MPNHVDVAPWSSPPPQAARVLFFFGEGGIGKSTLLRRATRVGWCTGHVVTVLGWVGK